MATWKHIKQHDNKHSPHDRGALVCRKCQTRLEVGTSLIDGRAWESCPICGTWRWLSAPKRSRTARRST